MALVFMDGFSGGDALKGKWDPSSNGYTTMLDANSRISGNYYAQYGTLTNTSKSFSSPMSKVIVGYGAYLYYQFAPLTMSFYGDTGGTQHITIVRNTTSGFLEVRRGGTGGALLATGTTQIQLSTWYYLEISCTISDTVGEVHVRLNGSPTDEVSYTGDTKNGGTNTSIDRLTFNVDRNNIADLYVLDGTGSAPLNDFLGDVAVRTLSPNGNGNYSQLTNSSGNSTNNYTFVDEHPYSSTDYVGSATSGQKDSYTLSDLPAGVSTVYALQVNGLMAKTDASLGQARNFLRSGGADYSGTTRPLATSFVSYADLYPTDPATGVSWTVSGVNNLETGMEVV
jgi:hypothetical protein